MNFILLLLASALFASAALASRRQKVCLEGIVDPPCMDILDAQRAIYQYRSRCREYGCHNGLCWSYCSFGKQWCYTSLASYSQSYQYVECDTRDDCSGCWLCAGSCTV
ncbi:Hypothetical protein NTJ_13895 [Nesidiocoris tenuis]|uniref:4Fe-4S ferredoxin-type domain-containing protein n=1 Tax=Nesidiocoris tenuis TaxID=355587 RepID=A0ABN7B9Y9_9HEMI|nr:Hypothetical protein NTJ_13895 [Nesidiocoris tenuis]